MMTKYNDLKAPGQCIVDEHLAKDMPKPFQDYLRQKADFNPKDIQGIVAEDQQANAARRNLNDVNEKVNASPATVKYLGGKQRTNYAPHSKCTF